MSSSAELVSPQFCNRGIMQSMLQPESDAPCFGKTLTLAMLRRTERLGIPKWFLQEHGDKFQMALSLTGPNGKSRQVTLRKRDSTRPRVYLCDGWIAFAKENGFQMGDEVIFWLVASSSFHVLVVSSSGSTTQLQTQKATFTTQIIPKDDEECGTNDSEAPAHQHPKGTTNHEEVVETPQVSFNPTEVAHIPTEVTPFQRLASTIREEEYVRYPGLNSAVSSNSRFPHFVKKLTPNTLNGKRKRLELPFGFVKEHGDKFQEHVALLGASGHLRVVNLLIQTFCGQDRVYLAKGWKDFALENEFNEGDVLLFSLVGLSTFVVKMFPGVGN